MAATITATTFHHFPLLPTEIRLMIWESAILPRTVDIRPHLYRRPYHSVTVPYVDEEGQQHWGPTLACMRCILDVKSAKVPPTPALLHVCRESREVALQFKGGYVKAFSKESKFCSHDESNDDDSNISQHCRECRYYASTRSSPQYIWVNFELDTIFTGVAYGAACGPKDGDTIKQVKLDLHHCGQRVGPAWKHLVISQLKSLVDGLAQLEEISLWMRHNDYPGGLPYFWIYPACPWEGEWRYEGQLTGWRVVNYYSVRYRDGEEQIGSRTKEDGRTNGTRFYVLVLRKFPELDQRLVYYLRRLEARVFGTEVVDN